MKRSRSPNSSISVTYQRRGGAILGFGMRGHARFAPAGRDIVCAAVSALVLSAAQGLRRYCGVEPAISDSGDEFRLTLPTPGNARSQAVLETMLSGLRAIAGSYPGYVSIRQTNHRTPGPDKRPAKSHSSRHR